MEVGTDVTEEHESVVVRSMRVDDLDAVVGIETATFSNPWQRETFQGLIDRPGVELMVMELPPEGIIGYAVLWCILDQGELANVAVTPEWRGKGLGRYLIGRVLDAARERGVKKMFLEVRASNERAAEIYGGFGFTEVGVRRDYYTRPREDARIMMATLS